MATVLLISDDTDIGDLLGEPLGKAGHSAMVCRSLAAAVRAIAAVKVDLICLEASLGALAVSEFCKWLQSDIERSSVPVLFLSPPAARWPGSVVPAFLRPQQDACLPRPLDVEVLTGKIWSMLSKTPSPASSHPHLIQVDSLIVDSEKHELWRDAVKVALTPTEYRLFVYMVKRPGVVVPVEELLERIWGFFPGTGTPAVVRVHMSNLRRKITALGGSDCPLRTLPHRGYCLEAKQRAD